MVVRIYCCLKWTSGARIRFSSQKYCKPLKKDYYRPIKMNKGQTSPLLLNHHSFALRSTAKWIHGFWCFWRNDKLWLSGCCWCDFGAPMSLGFYSRLSFTRRIAGKFHWFNETAQLELLIERNKLKNWIILHLLHLLPHFLGASCSSPHLLINKW